MERLHGNDFVRVRPFGRRGDKGCDGYHQVNGQVFQCYGKLDDGALNIDYVTKKMDDDYAKAASALALIMKEWYFVHNLIDGTPIEVTLKLKELERNNPHHKFGIIGPAGFEERVFSLDEIDIIDLLGPAATAQDTQNMRVEEVRDLINALISELDKPPIVYETISEVPRDKLVFNKINGCWSHIITMGTRNARYVGEYIGRHHDPEVGQRVAKVFSDRYADLKAQGLKPDGIMGSLYEGITGKGSVTPERQVAAQALLSYLFDACDIFEDHPSKVTT